MKNKLPFILLAGIVAIALIINSCKKQTLSPIKQLFVGGKWQLQSVLAFNYIGNTLTSTDTLNTTCDSTQVFIFTSGGCTYTNFDCIAQTSALAPWTLTPNQLFLEANVVCKDTSAISGGSSMPFANSQIINLGQFSLVLQTGDIEPNYSLTKPRRIVQYGFIRQKLNGTD